MTCVWQILTQSSAPKPFTGPQVKGSQHTGGLYQSNPTSHTSHFVPGTAPVYLNSISIYRKIYALQTEQLLSMLLLSEWQSIMHPVGLFKQSDIISVCFHYSQRRFITSRLQMQKPIDAIIIQNILFVSEGK